MDRFMIAPSQTGLETSLKPWLIPDDAYAQLINAYVWRGRTRKRFGSRFTGSPSIGGVTASLYSRASVPLGSTDGSGDAAGTVPGALFEIGQLFSIGNEIFTVQALGTPVVMLTTGASTTHTFNTTTGAYVFSGADINTVVYYYPAEPIMGLAVYDNGAVNDQPSYAFDTQFSYKFVSGFWQRLGTMVLHGDNSQFVWTTNWHSTDNSTVVLFISNFNVTVGTNPSVNDDPIYYTDDGTNWYPFTYSPVAGNVPYTIIVNTSGTLRFVQSALLMVPFKGCLLLLNVVENSGTTIDNFGTNFYTTASTNYAYPSRCRYSFIGSPFADNAWLEINQSYDPGSGTVTGAGAGYIDASTEEAIVTCGFIKDRLIVYFEQSTWEIVYTGNLIRPFEWQKLNTELGSDATFSIVPFDKMLLAVGNTGVHSCNGSNVERIDQKIPDLIFDISQMNAGINRIQGIRDYFSEMVYWTFASNSLTPSEPFPNQVLVYNYVNNSWAVNVDTFTCFGYYQQQQITTWENSYETWQESEWQWQSGVGEGGFRQIIAGNQEGFLLFIDSDITVNAQSLQITNMSYNAAGQQLTLTIINHTLSLGDYIRLEFLTGITLGGQGIYPVQVIVDADTIIVGLVPSFAGSYLGGGTAGRVSNIQILTKQWNPYVSQDRNVYIQKIDFLVDSTSDGQLTIDYFPSTSAVSMLEDGATTGALVGTGVLETYAYPTVPFEQYQDRLWHPVYFQTDGQCVQLFISMSQSQMMDPLVSQSDLQIHAMTLYTSPTTSRLQ